jgi:hypothetical protein
MNLLGLEQADYSLRQRVVVRVAGAAHGGFDTGLGPEFEAKRLELLKAALPKARRVAVLASRSGWDGAHGQRIRTARSWGLVLLHADCWANDYNPRGHEEL